MSDEEIKRGIDLLEEEEQETKEPDMYKVVLLNDNYTPREFVVEMLATVFRKSAAAAMKIMMTAHTTGRSVVGLYTLDIAQTKVSQARQQAKKKGYPLKFVVEGA